MGRIKGKSTSWVDLGFKANTFELLRADSEVKDLKETDEIEFKKLGRRYFENRNVYDNRVLAQRIGVESATTLPKQELIDRLLDKVWGVQYFSSEYSTFKKIEIGKMPAEIELSLLEDVKKGDVIIGEESIGVFEAKAEGGVLWNANGNFENEPNVFVLRNLVGEFSLRDGDLIKGRTRFVKDLGYYCMFHVDEINGVPVVSGSRPQVSADPINPYQNLDLCGKDRIIKGLKLFAPVCYGQFGVISTNGRMDFCEQAIRVFESIDHESVNVHLFIMEEKENVIAKAKERLKAFETVHYSILGDKKTDKMFKLLQYLSAQARGNGSKHVIIVSDLDMLDKTESENGVTATKLASFAGAYSNGGSVTIIAVAGTYSPLSAYHTVRNRLDFELALKSNLAVSKNVIDMLSSYSFSDREVSKEETVAIAKLQQLAVTEGNNAVERRLAASDDIDDIITQLND